MQGLTRDFFFIAGLVIALSNQVEGQVVDETRLQYEESQLSANQVGMSVSSDQKHIAFLLDNGELKIFDILNSVFIQSHFVELTDPLEIAFSLDNTKIIVVENSQFQVLDWKSGEVLFSQDGYDMIKTMRVAHTSDHFAVALDETVEIWDAQSFNRIQTLTIKKNLATVSFSYKDESLIINQKWSLFKNRYFIYNYMTGSLIDEVDKSYLATFDNTKQGLFFYKNFGYGIPAFNHKALGAEDGSAKVLQVFDGKAEKTNDVGIYLTSLRVGDKVVSAAGYRGFSVFDIKQGGRIFTTKKTKRDRSSKAINVMGDYSANPHYALNEDKVLVNAYGDNINQIYSAEQNAIVGYIFVDADGSYAVVSKDGRFDGTTNAAEKLYWTHRTSNKKTNLESTFSRGFTPGLLASLLQGTDDIVEFDITDEAGDLPVMQMISFNDSPISKSDETPIVTSNQKLGEIRVSVIENHQNATQIRLFHNNKLTQTVNAPFGQDISFPVTLSNSFGEDNYFYTVATTERGIDSEKKKLIVRYQGNLDEDPKMFLLTVGVNEYKNPKYNLNYAIADADAFSETVAKGAGDIFSKVEQINIRNQEFTKLGLMNALEQVKSSANEQDLFVFYYAGHGVMSEGQSKESEFFLVPHDITQLYGRDDMLLEKAISANDLKEISRAINAQKQVFILDACQSAAALDAVISRGISEEKAIAHLARSTGTFWMTATGSEQFATEFESLGHGAFTYALLEGLSGKADGANADNRITVRELVAYIESRVPELSEKHKGKPQFPAGYSFGNDFPIVIYE